MEIISIKGSITLDEIYNKLQDENIEVYTKILYSHPFKTDGKSIKLTLGRVWFNTIVPDDYPLINEPITNKVMNSIAKEIINRYEPTLSAKILSNIQLQAFKMATINTKSFVIDALSPSKEWLEKKDKFSKEVDSLSDDEYIQKSEKLTTELLKEYEDNNIGILDVIKSGTKGDQKDWEALMVSKGFVVDLEGNISRLNNSLNDGFDIEGYYKGGAEARKTLYTKSIMTSMPGYLARKVTMACANIQIQPGDCGTTRYLIMNITKSNAHRFIDRWYFDRKLKLIKNSEDLIGNKVKIRSPLYCTNKKGICEICYGNHASNLDNKNIGIMAGSAVNKETVNALMKAKHKSSQINIVYVDFNKILSNSSADTKTLNLLLDIQKNDIYAKREIIINIDEKEYGDNIIDLGDKYQISGIFDISSKINDNIIEASLPFNFSVNLFKPDNIETRGSIITLIYDKGNKILSKDRYIKELDPKTIDRYFEGGLKFISKPEILHEILLSELTKSASVHLELITANMFRSKDDLTIPGRLVNYENCVIKGAKTLPFIDSWLSGLSFENINKALKIGLVDGKDASLNPIEQIVIDRYYTEQEE